MAKSKRSELVTGLFVVVALAAGVGVVIWIGAADVFAPAGKTVVFAASLESGSLGLDVGSAVKFNDLPIGKIKTMRLDRAAQRTLYVARIEAADVDIRADARAVAVGEFIGGASIVLETLGSASAPAATADAPVPLIASNAMLRRMQDVLGYGDEQRKQFQQILANLAETSDKVNGIAATLAAETDREDDKALLSQLKATVGNLRDASANLRGETEKSNPDSLLAKVRGSADNVRAATRDLRAQADPKNDAGLLAKVHRSMDDLNAVTADARPKIKQTLTSVANAAKQVEAYTRDDVGAILADAKKTVAAMLQATNDLRQSAQTGKDILVLNRKNIEDTLANVKVMSLNLKAAAQEIRRNPWRLLHRPTEKELDTRNIYDTVRAFAEGAGRLDDAVARLEALCKARPEAIKPDDPDLIRIRKHLQETFKKFQAVENTLLEKTSK